MSKTKKSYAPESRYEGLFEGCMNEDIMIRSKEDYYDALDSLELWKDMKNDAIMRKDEFDRKSCKAHIQQLKIEIRNYKVWAKEHKELVA